MTSVPLVDLTALHQPLRVELHAALDRAIVSSAFTGGTEVDAFECELGAWLGVSHAIGVGSGTAALTLALVAAGIGRGDEVVLPPNTFIATAAAVMASGAVPVLADVDPDTALLDVDAAAAAITTRTAALIPVHLYGQPVDGDHFAELARRHGLFLLEDACQAIGAQWADRSAGSLGDAAAFSFYPSKNLGALGDGGAVTTNDPVLARRVRLLRNHGEVRKHDRAVWGACERLDALQAAFLRVKLARFGEEQRRRVVAATRYIEQLSDVPDVQLLSTAAQATHAWHLMVVRVPRRDAVLRALQSRGIGAAVHYPTPIHLQTGAVELGKPGDYPAAEDLSRSILTLPLWPGMGDELMDQVVVGLRDALEWDGRR